MLLCDKITKEEYLNLTIKEILEHSTRRNRGSKEEDVLLNDLERIEQIANRAKNILFSPKKEYSQYEIEKISLKEFKETIEKNEK